MRAQNVKALRKLLEDAVAASSGGGSNAEPSIYENPDRLAEWLVEAGGVLVPSAVTEQEAMDLWYKSPAEVYARVPEESKGPWLREALRGMATDSPFGGDDGRGEAVLSLKGSHRWGGSAAEYAG